MYNGITYNLMVNTKIILWQVKVFEANNILWNVLLHSPYRRRTTMEIDVDAGGESLTPTFVRYYVVRRTYYNMLQHFDRGGFTTFLHVFK